MTNRNFAQCVVSGQFFGLKQNFEVHHIVDDDLSGTGRQTETTSNLSEDKP